jgi:alkanesulfonate monooxygenase SsuD/methylene tetrahydromethanopterin reductase-like flavin-dependent oxidoreductase (luciferase family)
MKLGLQITDYTWPGGPSRLGATLAEIAQTAEGCGFDSISVGDHVWQVPPWMGPPEQEMLECYTTLAFLAAQTSRLTVMAMVTAVPFRYPGILAKTVTTLDVLSGGRAWLGIGAGHYADEAHGLGEDGSKTDELIGQLRWLAGMGIQTVFGAVPHAHQMTPLEVIGREVIPAVADL